MQDSDKCFATDALCLGPVLPEVLFRFDVVPGSD